MQHNPQKAKAGMLKLWASKNFAKRAFYMLTGFDELVSDKKNEKYLYYVDMAYDLIAPELSMENNAYTEVGKIVKALDDLIKNLKIVTEEAPSIILLGRIMIPKKLSLVKQEYEKMVIRITPVCAVHGCLCADSAPEHQHGSGRVRV